ncbi:MAG TPA: rhomboid family intramembrane serine protease [Xanthobacteraceae bacterium]|nr:rhomboid family intramembrane serine protease [Xanthobacteraceae bacterium]
MSAGVSQPREPIFNIPAIVVAMLAVLVFLHLFRVYWLSSEENQLLVWQAAFVPARFTFDNLEVAGWRHGYWLWTFVTYAFIHADFVHLGFNSVWLLAFGTAVSRRFGAVRFLVLFVLSAGAGAAAHLLAHFGDLQPLVGASASISGTMGAAARFAFQSGGPLDSWRTVEGDHGYRLPAAPLRKALRDPRVLAFLGAWFGLNLLFGLGSLPIIGEEQSIAWEAHVGGFLTGLLLFAWFDPIHTEADFNDGEAPDLH